MLTVNAEKITKTPVRSEWGRQYVKNILDAIEHDRMRRLVILTEQLDSRLDRYQRG